MSIDKNNEQISDEIIEEKEISSEAKEEASEPEAKPEVKRAKEKKSKERKKLIRKTARLITIVSLEIIAVIIVISIIFFADKKMHKVTFDLDGGVLISGNLEQRIPTGLGAVAPTASKYGYYLIGWSEEFDKVTQDLVVKAIWEYESTAGLEYSVPYNTNYCTVSGSFMEIQGDIYIGSYYSDRKVLSIGPGAFKDRTGISAVYMLDGILAIENEAFSGCTSLEYIEIPSTVVRIGENAFKDCTALKEIVLPASLETIDPGAFSGCTSLETIVFSSEVISVGSYAFAGCTALKEIALPSTVKMIDAYVFEGCSSLLEFTLPEAAESIEKGAFKDCTALSKVTLNETVISVGTDAFYGCTSLKEIVIPSSVESVGQSAFENCTSLKSVTMNNGINSIGRSAFAGCESLDYIFIPGTVRAIGKSAFNTPEMTIELYIKADQTPRRFFIGWCLEDATLVYGVGERDEEIEKYIAEQEEQEGDKIFIEGFIKDPTIIRPGIDFDDFIDDENKEDFEDILGGEIGVGEGGGKG